jgi:hypothetical protein
MKTLNSLLKTENIEKYYDKSIIFDETGPFLFSDKMVIKKMIIICSESKDLEMLQNTTECLLHISAHPLTMTWVLELQRHGYLTIAERLLAHCPDNNVNRNVLMTLANMAIDNVQTRDVILKFNNLLSIIVKKNNIPARSFFFRCILRICPIPSYGQIEPLFHVCLNHIYDEDIDVQEKVDILTAVSFCLNEETSYQKIIASNVHFLKYVMNPAQNTPKPILKVYVDIIGALIYYSDLHPYLLQNNIISLLNTLINHPEPYFREEALYSFCILADNPIVADEIVRHSLENIEKMYTYFQERRIRHCCVLTLFTLINTTTNPQIMIQMALEKKWIEWAGVFLDTHNEDANSIVTILLGLKTMCKFEKKETKNQMEDYEIDSKLVLLEEQHLDPSIQKACAYFDDYSMDLSD